MYEERKVKFNWKGFLIKLVVIILVLILVIKLLPLNSRTEQNGHSKIFNNNFTTLKSVGNKYFTKDNLPKDKEEVKVTLRQLINSKKISTLKGKDKKVCNEDASYIKSYKKNIGYELEVYLVCGEESDISHIYLGCFEDCNVKPSTTTTTTKKTTTKKKNSNSNKTGNNSNTSKTTKTTVTTTTRAKKYAVIYNENGGTKVKTEFVLPGAKATVPSNPSREGFIFKGWYLDGKLYDFNNVVNNNIILIAKWELDSTKPYTYNEVVYSVLTANKDDLNVRTKNILNIPSKLSNYQNVKVKNVSYIRNFNTLADITYYLENRSSLFKNEDSNLDNNATMDNFGALDNIEIINDNNSINWNGSVNNTCKVSLNGNCAYGIVYRVTWEYRI